MPTDTVLKRAQEFVDKLMIDAAAPHTGNFKADAEAFPDSGIHATALAERLAVALDAWAQEATGRLTEEIQARLSRLRKAKDYTDDINRRLRAGETVTMTVGGYVSEGEIEFLERIAELEAAAKKD